MTFYSEEEKRQYTDKMSGLLLAKIEVMKVIEKHLNDNKDDVDNLIDIIKFYKDCDKQLLSVEETIENDYRYKEEQTSNTNAAFFANKAYNINPSSMEKTMKKNGIKK